MTLSAGTRLASYEVACALGAGGMGEVYKARDTKLGRDVAIKILPELFVSDPERVARFQREAQTLAALNHPHIAAIHGLEESGSTRFLVLEFVDGESLAQRLEAGGPGLGHALAVGEALTVARQIVDALEAAHEKGIIHRDLKPANIMLTADGRVKVLDFGLAKYEAGGTRGAGEAGGELRHSPTLTFAATQAGVILGTAAYMSPEQAKGRAVDKRGDVWSFGCVLFEMLTGRRAFAGEDISDTLAAVLRGEPDWTALPVDVPPHVRALVKGCLEKDRKARIGDMAVARFLLDDGSTIVGTSTVEAERNVAKPAAWFRALPWASTAAFALALLLFVWAPWRKAQALIPLRLSAELGADASLVTDPGPAVALSPDGAMLAFVAQKGSTGRSQIYIRRLEQLQAVPLAGTLGANVPFFSPDGQWIAFFADGKLKKIRVTGGAAVTLCDAPSGRGGVWNEDGTIVFTPAVTPGTRLLRVSSAGGNPDALTTLAEGEVVQRWPQVLPGGTAVLYTSHNSTQGFDDANLVVQALPTGVRKVVQRGGYYGRYLRSGHLVYIHEGTLFAAPFDLKRLELTSQPVPVLEGVAATPRAGGANFAVSNNGTLSYVGGESTQRGVSIAWMDREGKTTSLRAAPSNWGSPRFSPDGRRLALHITDGRRYTVWVYEWERDTLSRLTFDAGDNQAPVWTPDGRRIAFGSDRGKATYNLYWLRADGSGEAQRLSESPNNQFPASWHPSGRFLAFEENNPRTGNDLMILPIEGDEASGWKPGKPTPFLNTPFNEQAPTFSPDGRWLAYFSTESGEAEVYVRPFPGPGGKWQISANGGGFPAWSRTRHELLYATTDRRIMVAPYTVEGESFRAGKPRLWSEAAYVPRSRFQSFDLHPDGDRLALAAVPAAEAATKQDKIVFIFNFFDELERVAPSGRP